MDINDLCLFCKKNLRIHGQIGNTVSIFGNKSKSAERSLVTWLITLMCIICPSTYKARPYNLIGQITFWSDLIPPNELNSRLILQTKYFVGGVQAGIQARWRGDFEAFSLASLSVHTGLCWADQQCKKIWQNLREKLTGLPRPILIQSWWIWYV